MAGWWAEAKTGLCYREQGIACADGTCGHCDGARMIVKENKMARETKAERLVREAAEHEARVEALKAEYPERLMAALARAYENNYEVVPKLDNLAEFRLVDRDERDNAFTVGYAFTEENDATLNELDWTLTYKEEKVREERRKMEVRNAAWYKLTEEERQLLGLTNY